jgi:hypothetical protein
VCSSQDASTDTLFVEYALAFGDDELSRPPPVSRSTTTTLHGDSDEGVAYT